MEKERLLRNISTHPQVLGFSRHRSVPKRQLVNAKHSANTTQMNFSKGLKLPSTRGMKSINDDSAEDNITNQSHPEEGDAMNIQANPEYHTDNDGNDKTSLNLIAKTRRRIKQSKKRRYEEKEVSSKIRPFPTTGTSISPHRILLFEKTTKIGKKEYLVEISRDKLHLFIIAFLIEKAKYYTMQIPIKQAFKLLLELDNSFDALVGMLYFSYNTLLLPDIIRNKFSPRQLGHLNMSQATSQASHSRANEMNVTMDKSYNSSKFLQGG
jgi:hypothetical protein